MKRVSLFGSAIIVMSLLTACNKPTAKQEPAAAEPQAVTLGGEQVATLERPKLNDQSKPQFLQVQVAPGLGMNILQVKAFIPGKGDIDLFASPSLADMKKKLEENNEYGNENFKVAGALLVPYPN